MSMKYETLITVTTVYNDGAGNSCTYTYDLKNVATVTTLDNAHWMARAVRVLLPPGTRSFTAVSLASSVGAPPAYTTRTMTLSKDGIMTLGTNETFPVYTGVSSTQGWLTLKVTLREAAANTYLKHWFMAGLLPLTDGISRFSYASLASSVAMTASASPLDLLEASTELFKTTSEYVYITTHPSAADAAIKKITFPILCWGDYDLLTREYDQRLVEGGLKALLIGLQAVKGRFEGAAAQLYGKLRGQGITDLDMPFAGITVSL
jgi:hypothetical protein